MECEWLKNESNYFVTCKYFQLILQPLQTFVTHTIYIYIYGFYFKYTRSKFEMWHSLNKLLKLLQRIEQLQRRY